MADIQVRIKLNAGVDGDQINSVAFNKETNNVSKAVGSKTTKNDGQNLISWGEDGLISLADGYVGGANSTLSSQGGYNGFVFGVVPDNKMYSVEITLEGSNIDSVTFYGDRNANQFPTRAILNGEYIYSDDAEWTIVFPNSADTQTITFDMWNRANYNACFTHIVEFTNELVLDKKWIKSVESLSQSTGQPKDIYYGVTPSSGSVEIIDINGELYDYINDGIMPNNPSLDIVVNDNRIMKHIQNNSDYLFTNMGGKLSLELTDIANSLSLKENIDLPLRNASNGLLVFQYVLRKMGYTSTQINSITEQKIIITDYVGEEYQEKEITIYEFLRFVSIPYPYLESSNYLEVFNKFCKLLQVNMIASNTDGDIFMPKVITSRPRMLSNEIPIYIPLKNQFSGLNYSLFPKNVIKSVNVIYRDMNYELQQINNKRISLYDYNIKDNTITTIPLLSNAEKNPEITILYEDLRDYNSHINSSAYDGYLFSIIKYNLPNVVRYENPKFRLTANGSLTAVDILNNVSNGTDSRVISENDIMVYNGGESDNYVIQNWTNGAYIHQEYANKFVNCAIRNNGDSLDVFVCFITKRLKKATNQNEMIVSSFNFLLDMRNLSYTDVTRNQNSDLDISSNELIQDGTEYGVIKIYDLLEESIKRDYKNGISIGNITISCNDYYDINGNAIKDFSKGEIISVGDVVKIEGNNKLWRVTGRNFRKAGVPMIDLELQEVIV